MNLIRVRTIHWSVCTHQCTYQIHANLAELQPAPSAQVPSFRIVLRAPLSRHQLRHAFMHLPVQPEPLPLEPPPPTPTPTTSKNQSTAAHAHTEATGNRALLADGAAFAFRLCVTNHPQKLLHFDVDVNIGTCSHWLSWWCDASLT